MTRPVTPPAESEVSQATVDALHALYRDAAGAEPAPALDRAILDAARAEVRTGGASKRRTPWWKRWLPATAAVAVAVMGLSLTWRVMDEQERHLREEMKEAESLRERPGETAGHPAPAQRAVEAMPPVNAQALPAEKSRRAESAAVRDAPLSVPEPPAMPAPTAPAAMAPAPPEEAMKKSRRAETDELRERRDAATAADSASGPARQAGKLEAGSLGASGATAADILAKPVANSSAKFVAVPTAQPAADPATREAWLKHIRDLRAAGRVAEAAQSLARFRARYPDLVLPDDLLNLK